MQRAPVPNLRALMARGAVGAMTVRTVSATPTLAEGYATLGAGARVQVAATLSSTTTSGRDGQPLVVDTARGLIAANRGRHLATAPGALGDALHADGRRTAIVETTSAGSGGAPVALAAMDRAGSVDAAWVIGAGSDAGDRATATHSGSMVVAAVGDALSEADVVFVDTGEIPEAGGQGTGQPREQAVGAGDALLGAVAARLPPSARLIVLSVVPPAAPWHLAPVVVVGPGVPHGYVVSPSTRRLGLVSLTDMAPEIVMSVGAKPPAAMIGRPFRYRAGRPDLGRLAGLDRDGRARATTYFPIALGFVVLHGLVYLAAAWVLTGRRRAVRLSALIRLGLLAIAAFPLATFLLRIVPPATLHGWAAVALAALDAGLVLAVSRARFHVLAPLFVLSASTVAVLVVDVASGARLQVNSILGYAPLTADRFYGIGGTALGVLVASTLVATAIYLDWSRRRRDALAWVGATFVVVVVAAGASVLGAKVGSILTMVPVFVVTFAALAGFRPSWKTIAVALGVTVAVVAAAGATELLRPATARSHLGELLGTSNNSGGGTLATVIARKASTDVRVFLETVWSWLALIVTLFLAYLLVRDHRFVRILPRGSALRVGALALVGAGVLGLLVNDTGIIITSLVLVYLGPYLALLALDATSRHVGAVPAPTDMHPPVKAEPASSVP
ncbi:MAG: hypothetical protein JOZ68_07640 [Acidimicrobiia bacterium]|nr:hypothetical protein [Acidimicrobiia bacterium]